MRFLEIGESMLSPRNEHHFLGAAIGGIFGTLQQSSANRAASQSKTNDTSKEIAEMNNQFNAEQAQLS